jgi:catalase
LRRFKEYPEARKSIEQKAKMPLTGSFSGAEFYVVNAFILWAANGQEQPVRWSMHPHSKFISRPKNNVIKLTMISYLKTSKTFG